jgi:hypothetical protein
MKTNTRKMVIQVISCMFNGALERIDRNLSSWEDSLIDPQTFQKGVLRSLLEDYAETEYGQSFSAESDLTIEDYRERFPTASYDDLKPWFRRVQLGDYRAFLVEEPKTWVMTRGTTGKPKVLPITSRHLQDLFKCGSRAVLNFSMRKGGLELLTGGVLNLQFPSNVETLRIGGRDLVYGFSSGTYAKLNPMMMGLSLIPRQEDVDALGTDLSRRGWERRYEFIYHQAKDEEIVTVMGVAPVQTGFARYLKKEHGVYPRDLWKLKVIYSTSVPKIQTKYGKRLRRMYGDVPLVEMYTATEGAFGQQRDDLPYFMPNYDTYFFEVKTGGGYKMLHELKRGEWGRLIISTAMLPRYDIGDLIEGMGKNYFRVFGRTRLRTVVEHVIYRALFRWFL